MAFCWWNIATLLARRQQSAFWILALLSSVPPSFTAASFLSSSTKASFQPTLSHGNRGLICWQARDRTSSSLASSIDGSSETLYEIQRFKSRAALAEHVLKEKVQDLKLLKKKLVVLQDVVQRLKQSQTKEKIQWQQQANETTTVEWRDKWQEEEKKRIDVEMSLRKLQEDLNTTRWELQVQRNHFETSLEQLQDSYDRDRKQWQREIRLQQDQEKKVQLEIAALQKEVLDMDQSLESAQNELAKLQQGNQLRVNQLEQSLQEQQRKCIELKRQLDIALSEQQKMKSEMDQLSASAKESILVATSSVQAAERREKALQVQVEALQQQIQTLAMQEKNQQDQAEAETVSTEGKTQTTNEQKEQLLKLQSEVERLENQLRMERLTAAAQKRIDQRQFREALTQQRDQYEIKLRWNAIQDSPRTRSLWHRLRSRFPKRIGQSDD